MPNWLADATKCALRLKNESGCTILAGRNEVMSRSTVCVRTEEHDGVYWRWGHLYARRETDTRGQLRIVLGSYGTNPSHTTESAAMMVEHSNVASDLLRAAYSNNGGHTCGGQTLHELMWDELMTIMDRLMTGTESEDGGDKYRAEGVAYALAVFQNPYLPNLDDIREQAMAKWQAEYA